MSEEKSDSKKPEWPGKKSMRENSTNNTNRGIKKITLIRMVAVLAVLSVMLCFYISHWEASRNESDSFFWFGNGFLLLITWALVGLAAGIPSEYIGQEENNDE